jgi:REP element-mobilizing transposase RayT
LISESDCYAAFYRWFEYLKSFNILTIGFVIMPNHFHGIFFIPHNCKKSINQILSDGKRFLAYEIINKLQILKKTNILEELNKATTLRERHAGKRHRVFKTSSDIKEIYDHEMLIKKLDYIHHNPCKGKWLLVDDFRLYRYSSAAFYELNSENEYIIDYRIIG